MVALGDKWYQHLSQGDKNSINFSFDDFFYYYCELTFKENFYKCFQSNLLRFNFLNIYCKKILKIYN